MKTVVLDYGHGGRDGGAVALDGKKESDLNLEIGKILKTMLEDKGVKVFETRGGDEYVQLVDRINKVSNINYDMFLSLHCNSFNSSSAKGLEVYYEGSKRLAEVIYNKLVEKGLYNSLRGVKYEQFYVITNAEPSALVEMGFISNKEDLELILNKKKEFAYALCEGVTEFLGVESREVMYYVQVGAYKERRNAEELAKKLKDDGYNVYIKEVY